MSIAEQPILHVTNAHPAMEDFMSEDPFSSSSSAAAAAASVSSFSSHEPQVDGKGRMRHPSQGKVPLVHLDGGRVQQQLEAVISGAGPAVVAEAGAGPAPPAYEAYEA